MKSNPNASGPYDEDCDKEIRSPIPVRLVATNALTLPSSNGSSGSISSDAGSILASPPIEETGDDPSAAAASTAGCNTTKIILVTTAFVLLFSAGLLGGLAATGKFSRIHVASTNSENQTVDATSPTASPTAPDMEIVDIPAAAPSNSDPTARPATPPPTESPTEITADVSRIPIPPPPTSEFSPDGTYNYRANSEYLVGV